MPEDEELSPILENLVVLSWLKLIHPSLPRLVKQQYGTELRSCTLALIKPDISQALESLLDEIRASDDAKILRTAVSADSHRRPAQNSKAPYKTATRRPRPDRVCPLCKQAGRSETKHFLSECSHLPDCDRRYIVKARQITDILDDDSGTDDDLDPFTPTYDPIDKQAKPNAVAFRIQTRQSPYIDVHHVIRVTVDSGATGNMIRHSTAKRLGSRVIASSQSVHQADGSSPLQVIGETRVTFTRDQREFKFEGLVVENLDVDVLAGTPFMEANDVAVRPAKREVILGDGTVYEYGSSIPKGLSTAARRAFLIRTPTPPKTIWPGEFLEIQLPDDAQPDAEYAVEPRTDTSSVRRVKPSQIWPQPCVVPSVARKIRIPNLSTEPHTLKRNEHLCQAIPVFEPKVDPTVDTMPKPPSPRPTKTNHSSTVQVDPDNLLPQDVKSQFQSLLIEYDSIFDPKIKGYNDSAGPFKAKVNMGPVEPPQRKGCLPQYNRGKLVELQETFDHLGVFQRPEEAGVAVEYLNPSFLVKKSNGGHRLVTAFADVGRYSKPQPSLLPDVDSTLRHIAQWRHIIKTDLTSAFYQIPLAQESMKYCGVATPFKGVRVYKQSAMGMPGSETALEELMCLVLVSCYRKAPWSKSPTTYTVVAITPRS